jgi:hypothetical protein
MAFPFVAEMPGVDSSLLRSRKRQQSGGANPGGPATCPNNLIHVAAPGISDQYPYNGAKNGQPGNGKGGYQVPAPGDTAHYFVAPGPNDIVRALLLLFPQLTSFLYSRLMSNPAWTMSRTERRGQSQLPCTRWHHHLQRACRCSTKYLQRRIRFGHSPCSPWFDLDRW